jgi:hypothetical protein
MPDMCSISGSVANCVASDDETISIRNSLTLLGIDSNIFFNKLILLFAESDKKVMTDTTLGEYKISPKLAAKDSWNDGS